MFIATIEDREDFNRVRRTFVCADEGQANFLAGRIADELTDAEGSIMPGRFAYTVAPVEVLT